MWNNEDLIPATMIFEECENHEAGPDVIGGESEAE
jgi:hypothetical protein